MTARLASYGPLLIWLALVWVLLWGSLAPAVLVSAVVVAPLCLAACRVPALPRQSHPRWHRLPLVFVDFLRELVVSSVQVAWTTVRVGPRTRSGLLAVPVRCASDIALTVAANRLSLVPGTLVVTLDRDAGVLYLFVLDLRRPADAERARREAERGTDDLLRALGAGTAGPADTRPGATP